MKKLKHLTIATMILGLLLVPLYWFTSISIVGLIGYVLMLVGSILWILYAVIRRKGHEDDSVVT